MKIVDAKFRKQVGIFPVFSFAGVPLFLLSLVVFQTQEDRD